jgi:diguanylate cyclase (GGDEF)-like protein
MTLWDLGLLGAQLLLYFSVMATLFGLRHRYGVGIFYSALGAMHFLETYLAATFYVAIPFGIVVSPGSTILFAGKIMLLLLVYIREDAVAVRQPIYGLFVGNILTIALIALLRLNNVLPTDGPSPDFLFMNQMGVLMVWGTLLLLADGILIILVYEQIGRWFHMRLMPRIAAAGVIVLAFDQLAFWPVLHWVTDVPVVTLFSGLIAKTTAAIACGALVAIYLRFFEPRLFDGIAHPRLADIFDTLTYRERYQELLEHTGRDGLTGIPDRGRMETEVAVFAARAINARDVVSVLLLDIDNFKRINDRDGHIAGDAVLRTIADMLRGNLRDSDRIYRFGGDEFVVVTVGLPSTGATRLAERLRRRTSDLKIPGVSDPLSISIGVATAPNDGNAFSALLETADKRLYAAKDAGKNRVVGSPEPENGPPGLAEPTPGL